MQRKCQNYHKNDQFLECCKVEMEYCMFTNVVNRNSGAVQCQKIKVPVTFCYDGNCENIYVEYESCTAV